MKRIKQIAVFRIHSERHATFATARHIAQCKSNERLRHGETLDNISNRLGFRAIRTHEFKTRRRGKEQIAQLNNRTFGQSSRFHWAHRTAVHGNLMRIMPRCTRGDYQTSDSAERGQRLSAKSERMNVEQITAINLGSRMT